jgi:hypothetical protein
MYTSHIAIRLARCSHLEPQYQSQSQSQEVAALGLGLEKRETIDTYLDILNDYGAHAQICVLSAMRALVTALPLVTCASALHHRHTQEYKGH